MPNAGFTFPNQAENIGKSEQNVLPEIPIMCLVHLPMGSKRLIEFRRIASLFLHHSQDIANLGM